MQRDQIGDHRRAVTGGARRPRAWARALHAAVMAGTIDEALIRQKSAEAAAVDADLAVARAQPTEVFRF